jgi:actin-related protein 6
MPRQSQAANTAGIKDRTLVIDNGGYTIKAGFVSAATPDLHDCQIIPNCIARDSDKKVWVASQLEQCKDFREMAFGELGGRKGDMGPVFLLSKLRAQGKTRLC